VPFYWVALIALIAVPAWGWYRPPRIDWLFLIPGVILIWAIAKHVATRHVKLTVGIDKLSLETGFMAKITRTVPIAQVQHVRVEQSMMQRMLGTGNLILESGGGLGRLVMESVDRPHQVTDEILSQMNKPEKKSTGNHV
jgi:uncharacterized membrane protein YdbT with pleckstrin-like domain